MNCDKGACNDTTRTRSSTGKREDAGQSNSFANMVPEAWSRVKDDGEEDREETIACSVVTSALSIENSVAVVYRQKSALEDRILNCSKFTGSSESF